MFNKDKDYYLTKCFEIGREKGYRVFYIDVSKDYNFDTVHVSKDCFYSLFWNIVNGYCV